MTDRSKRAFTIVEILIVVTVVAVLAAILIPTFDDVIDRSHARSALAEAETAVGAYKGANTGKLEENIVIFVSEGNGVYVYGYNRDSDKLLVGNGIPYRDIKLDSDYTFKDALVDMLDNINYNGARFKIEMVGGVYPDISDKVRDCPVNVRVFVGYIKDAEGAVIPAPTPVPSYYTLTYDPGIALGSMELTNMPQTVTKAAGSTVMLDTTPTFGALSFIGWKSSVDGALYNSMFIMPSSNVTLTAMWSYTVTFLNGSIVYNTRTAGLDGKFTVPDDPQTTEIGMHFAYWELVTEGVTEGQLIPNMQTPEEIAALTPITYTMVPYGVDLCTGDSCVMPELSLTYKAVYQEEKPTVDALGVYRIYNAVQLKWFGSKINTPVATGLVEGTDYLLPSASARLMRDVVLNKNVVTYDVSGNRILNAVVGVTPTFEQWAPICTNPLMPFTGSFTSELNRNSGLAHSISGMYINISDFPIENVGFISCAAGATISNIGFKDSYVSNALNGAAMLIGYSLNGNVTITNCYSDGCVFAKQYAGGLVGRIGNTLLGGIVNAVFEDCYNTALVSTLDPVLSGCAGGILAMSDSSAASVTMTSCYNRGKVTSASDTAGGLIGMLFGTNNANVLQYCYNTAEVKAVGAIAGGLVGSVGNMTTFTSCSNYGYVEGLQSIGGIVGYVNSSLSSTASTFSLCYNEGNIKGTSTVKTATATSLDGVGGIAGYISRDTTTPHNGIYTFTHCANTGNILDGGVYIGGIIGRCAETITRVDIDHCYNTAVIIGRNRVGGIVGICRNIVIRVSYNTGYICAYDTDSTTEMCCGALTGTSFAEMNSTTSPYYVAPSYFFYAESCTFSNTAIYSAFGTSCTREQFSNGTVLTVLDADFTSAHTVEIRCITSLTAERKAANSVNLLTMPLIIALHSLPAEPLPPVTGAP